MAGLIEWFKLGVREQGGYPSGSLQLTALSEVRDVTVGGFARQVRRPTWHISSGLVTLTLADPNPS